MGEMIKFGIKLALTIATAVALCAAILILFNLISNLITFSHSTNYAIRDIARLISLCLPFDTRLVFTTLTSLFSFKVAYWAADKMIQFISASS